MRDLIDLIENRGTANWTTLPPLLYHGTSLLNAALIVQADIMYAENEDDPPVGLSMTTNLLIAKEFATDEGDLETLWDVSADRYEEMKKLGLPSGVGAMITISTAAIANKARSLIHFQHPDVETPEDEIRAIGKQFKGASSFIESIAFSRADLDWWLNACRVGSIEADEAPAMWIPAFNKLANHPKARIT